MPPAGVELSPCGCANRCRSRDRQRAIFGNYFEFIEMKELGAGASIIFVDCIRLARWRNEYESSIKRVIRLSDRK